MKAFDRKFGADFVAELPTGPAVYLFADDEGRVLYVGKAKNVKKRLSSYRNATRRKVHRKMRRIVKAASSLEVRPQPSEREALLVENELIRALRPKFNVDGKYDFLYPAIGLGRDDKRALLCFTTDPEAYEAFGLTWYGTFRSRGRALEAFDALVELLALLGHIEPAKALGERPKLRGSKLRGVRQLDHLLFDALSPFFAGTDDRGLRLLSAALVDKPRARREAADVQERLHLLADFYETDLAPLREALRVAERPGTYVRQSERDALFIQYRSRIPAER